jgi:hypothetical protein
MTLRRALPLAFALLLLVACDSHVTPSDATEQISHQPPRKTPDGAVLVSPDNFIRAESDLYFQNTVKEGGFGKFHHNRELTPLDKQLVVRQNRDTLYSAGVFDLDAAPVTVTLPDPGDRFMSLQVITEDEYVPEVVYSPGLREFTRNSVGTRYAMLAVRILVNPNDPADMAKVHALQDAIVVKQDRVGTYLEQKWDPVSQGKVRTALMALASTVPDSRGMFGTKDDTDPVRRLIGAASAWGGNPEKDALYLNVTPSRNDAATVYRVTVGDVPVDAFWSLTVYNALGYFTPNPLNAYSVNNITATRGADGKVTVQFGGCDGKIPNCLPITLGWNYMVRLYRPKQEVLDGKWTFPEAQPV